MTFKRLRYGDAFITTDGMQGIKTGPDGEFIFVSKDGKSISNNRFVEAAQDQNVFRRVGNLKDLFKK